MQRVTLYGRDGAVFHRAEAEAVDIGEHGARHLVLRTGTAVTSILLAEGHTAIIAPVPENEGEVNS